MEKNIKFIFLLGFILALGAFFILPNNDDFYCLLLLTSLKALMSFCQMEHFGDHLMLHGDY